MDIYAEITNRIVSQMEQGVIPWRKPWVASGSAMSYATGKPYSLLNQMLLSQPGEYVTYHEAKKSGGHVKKGAKASLIVFWRWIESKDDETGEIKRIPFLRYYNVFHIDQCEGLSAKHTQPMPNAAGSSDIADDIISSYLLRSGVTLKHNEGDRAYYAPALDTVVLPLMAQFASTAEYYSTLFHELTHSTGHASRLGRINKVASFGSDEYSREELTAEIGAAALVNHAGLETASSFRNNAAYIQNWLSVLRNDKRFIVSAAGKAEKAINLILGL